MDELLELYQQLEKQLQNIIDNDILISADYQMSKIEDWYPELLKKSAPYLTYIPKEYDAKYNIHVLGADGHFIAHAIDILYQNSMVNWITNIEYYNWDDKEKVDYCILSPNTIKSVIEKDDCLKRWSDSLKGKAVVIICVEKLEEESIGVLYDLCNINGLLIEEIDCYGIAIVHRHIQPYADIMLKPRYKTVYVACPAGIKTGGTEVLHQLVYWINHYYGNAVLALYNRDKSTCLSPPELAEYVAGHMCLYEEIEDSCENAIVLPEVCPLKGVEQRKAAQYYWWLSVDNYVKCFEEKEGAHAFIQSIDSNTRFHLTQSEYSKRFLIDNGISNSKILRLEDYINQCYLDDVEEALSAKKEDIILYNPRKGKEIVDELVRKAPALNWVPIQNMTTSEVRTLMRRSKVYVDFGNHPGKDRIPREAAISGCIVITGKRGSALYEEDVSIPENYKFDDECIYEDIITLIKKSLKNYEEDINNFKNYRKRITEEKDRFVSDILSIFFEPYM